MRLLGMREVSFAECPTERMRSYCNHTLPDDASAEELVPCAPHPTIHHTSYFFLTCRSTSTERSQAGAFDRLKLFKLQLAKALKFGMKQVKPHLLTRVTEYMPEIVAYIQRIIENGFAYPAGASAEAGTSQGTPNGGCSTSQSVYFNTEADV